MGDFTPSIIKCIHTCWQLDKNKCLYLPIIAPLQRPEGRSEISSAGLFSIWREALLRMYICRLKQECRHRKETKSSASWHEPGSLKYESPLGEKNQKGCFSLKFALHLIYIYRTIYFQILLIFSLKSFCFSIIPCSVCICLFLSSNCWAPKPAA